MNPSPADEATVSYSVPRQAVIRYGMRQLLKTPQNLIWLALPLLLCAAAVAVGGSFVYAALFAVALTVFVPLQVRRSWIRAIDANPVFTEHRTMTFRPSGFTIINPRGKTDSTWDAYSGLSEDSDYFYLDIPGTRIANMVPKSAFTQEQMTLFRRCAGRQQV
jgi:hypothetical protein